MDEKEMALLVNDYKEGRTKAYAELSERLGYMICELEHLKAKTDWAKENGRRVNIDTNSITMLFSSMTMMVNTAERIAKDNEILILLGYTK